MTPIVYIWTGFVMQPTTRYADVCNEQFKVGFRYQLAEVDKPSQPSWRHYFACVKTAYDNLPEGARVEFKNEDHLRKWALIEAGYCKERTIACRSHEEALRAASEFGDYDIVRVEEDCLRIWEAESQRQMGKKRFEASKDAVLRVLSTLIGVAVDELLANGGRAA